MAPEYHRELIRARLNSQRYYGIRIHRRYVNVSSSSSILVALALFGSAGLSAQGIATTSIRGTARGDDGSDLTGASIRALNTATGVSSKSVVRQGHFLLQGLEIGGPYTVEIRRIGFVPERTSPVFLMLGEPLEVQFTMRRIATALDTVLVTTSQNARPAHGGGGPVTTIPDDFLHRLPTLDRNVFDFVRLTPQVSTKIGSQRIGLSAAGANVRFNNFLINGADERAVNGNVSIGINGGKSIPIDAVKEYQVLVAPYDVRYGDFTGALVNTVTRSGTNDFRGSAFSYWRNDRLARGGDTASTPYDRLQSGLSLGGAIVRDRVHFFLAAELQRITSPAEGSYIGQPATALDQLRVNAADIDRIDTIMNRYGLVAGSAGAVTNRSALRNMFARIDASFPALNSRLVAFSSYSDSDDPRFSRAARDTFYLSTYKYTGSVSLKLTSVQFHTDLLRTSGGHNELIVSQVKDGQDFLVDVHQPVVRVLVPATDGGLITLTSGTTEAAQGRYTRNRSVTVKDELTLPLSTSHMLVLGAQAERYRVQRAGVSGGYGTWTFTSLDSLEQGLPDRYELREDFGSATAPLRGGQYAIYLGDQWRPTQGLAITTGIRADALTFSSHAPYNPTVDSIFGRRTDEAPRAHVHLSPRLGFTWDINGREGDQLRGGIGVFVGRPPRAWMAPGVTSYGVGIGRLRCGSLAADNGLPPKFISNYESAPTACRNGSSIKTAVGDVDLIDRNLHMAESQRFSLAYDHRLGAGTTLTTEALYSRNVSDFIFVNLNLKGPQTTDVFGRVLYGTIGGSGIATPALKSNSFSEVIDLRNTSKNYSYQLTNRVEKRFANGFAATASYTYSRVRDVQSPSRVNLSGIALWSDARAVSGRHDDLTPGTSLNDLPHRIVTAITYAAPWKSGATEFSLYYVGESGSPFTYVATGAGGRGDLNADGSNSNDPVYVPRDAFDTREIVFDGQSNSPGADNTVSAQNARISLQQAAFNRFIDGSRCLRRQRGSIVERNSCREPWSHTSIAGVRHSVAISGHAVEAELEIFNVLNLFNSRWGRYRVSAPRLLEQVQQTAGPVATAQPIFRFDTSRSQWTTLQTESAFQLQLGIRYRL